MRVQDLSSAEMRAIRRSIYDRMDGGLGIEDAARAEHDLQRSLGKKISSHYFRAVAETEAKRMQREIDEIDRDAT